MLSRLFKPDSNVGFRYLIIVAVVVALFAIGYLVGNLANGVFQPQPPPSSTVTKLGGGALVDPPHRLQDFTLTSQTGEPISLSDLRGKAVLMFFGYTHCPDVCPLTLADYRQVKRALGDAAGETAFVFISVDGARDTPAVVAEYLSRFDDDFIGMTGNEIMLRRIGEEYGLIFQQETSADEPQDGLAHEHQNAAGLDNENYFVQHTSPSFLIDRDGYLRMVFFYGTETDAIAEGIRETLKS